MKKILALMLSCLVTFSTVTVAYASDDSKKINEMLSVVKSRIGSTEMYDEFNSSMNTYGSETQYRFNWYKSDNDNYAGLNITVNSNTIIKSYDLYDSSNTDSYGKASINRPTYDEALKTAEKQFKKLNPDIADKIKITKLSDTENLYGEKYDFGLQRYENGIPVLEDDGYLSVSSDAAFITSFYINYTDDLSFESSDNLINREQAMDYFEKNFGMNLSYADDYSGKDKKTVLQYAPDMQYDEYISAVNGEVIKQKFNNDNTYREAKAAGSALNASQEMADDGFTEAELGELEKIEGLMSANEAEKVIRNNKYINIGSDFKIVNQRMSRNFNDDEKYIYNFIFVKNKKSEAKEEKRVYVSVDAATGEIISFNKSGSYSPDKKNKLSSQQAANKADEAVKFLAPAHFGDKPDYVLDNDFKTENGYFRYVRQVNGIVYKSDYVTVSVDLTYGSIESYSIEYSNIDFPSPDGVLSEHEASQKLFEQVEYSLCYLPMYEENKGDYAVPVYSVVSTSKSRISPYIPYRFGGFEIDAFTGKLLYADDESKLTEYDDIEGHYAQEAITALAKYGIGFEGGSFKPDSVILQKDFAALLVSALLDFRPIILKENSDYTDIYDTVKIEGIIDDSEYEPDSEVTRSMAAKMMIRAIDADEIAELDGIFVSVFGDIYDKPGYTSILSAMGVIGGDENGNFNPDAFLTRGDAAIMIYNYLAR